MHMNSTNSSPAGRSIEFRLGTSLLRRSQAIWFTAILIGLSLAALGTMTLLTVTPHGESVHARDMWEGFLHRLDKDPRLKWHIWLFASVVPLALLSLWAQRVAYIRLSAQGIEGYVPKWTGIGIRGLSTGHWQVLWESIRSARLSPGKQVAQLVPQLAGYRLVIDTDRGQIRLSPFFWVLRNGPDHRLTLRQTLLSKNSEAAELIKSARLIQAMRERGITFAAGADAVAAANGSTGYDIRKHRGLVMQLVLFFGAGLYALIDGLFIGSFKPLEPLPVAPFVLTAAAGLAFVAVLGREAPIGERVVVGLLTVVALTSAVYPGLLRFNAITAEPRMITYKAVALGRFEPANEELPPVDLSDLKVHEYWAQYPAGTEHEFRLLRGAGGFYQIDLGALYARTRDFYSKKG